MKRTDSPTDRTDARQDAFPADAPSGIVGVVSSSRPRIFLLHLVGWAAFGGIMFVTALPWRAVPGVLVDRAVCVAGAFLCSFPLWGLCRGLWRRGWAWPRVMLAAAVCCYLLGYLCTLAGGLVTGWLYPPPPPLRAMAGGLVAPYLWPPPMPLLLVYALRDISTAFGLLTWCGLYLGFKQLERVARAETLAREAQLRALRYQLTPHFLLNTLNGISTLVGESRIPDARRMIARLGDFLRATLEGVGSLEVTLAQEVHFMEQYLAIEQARLGERLRVDVRIAPEALDAQVPNLLLQPLVENAILHGITPFPAGGELAIRAGRTGEQVNLSVHNTSRGEPAASGSGEPAPGIRRKGLGLKNIEDRLHASHGIRQTLAFRQLDAHSWEVVITLPYRAGANGDGRRAASA